MSTILIDYTPTPAPDGAVAWKYEDPTAPAGWLYDETEAERVAMQDPGLVEWPTLTVDEILAKIEDHINTHDWDPVNTVGCWFIAWSGEPASPIADRNADHVYIGFGEAYWDDVAARMRLDDEVRDDLIDALRATARFDKWAQSIDALDVLAVSGVALHE